MCPPEFKFRYLVPSLKLYADQVAQTSNTRITDQIVQGLATIGAIVVIMSMRWLITEEGSRRYDRTTA